MHSDPTLIFPAPPDVLRQRMMVAEFVARQHQNGSPLNGETPNQNHLNSNMPGSHLNNSNNSMLDMSPSSNNDGSYIHDGHNSLRPMSPQSPSLDGFPPGYDIAAHLKRKELFTQRKQREFIPDNKKDDSYWDRRRRNNEAAKRSREKRRFNDMVLEQRVVELTKENHVLKAQLEAIKDKYNICGENLVNVEQVMATFPSNEQVLSITKRAKLSNSVPPTLIYPQSPSPVPTSVIHQTVSSIHDSPTQQLSSSHHHHYNSRQSTPQHHTNNNNNDCYREQEQYPHHHYTPYPITQHELHYSNRDRDSNNRDRENNNSNNNISNNMNNNNNNNSNSQDDENVLNLSRRPQSPYEISSGNGSGDDEQCDNPPINNESNNSLPLKLRHKSHLGDKDAASALLSLQNIKQEPNSRFSPPWDNEGSSDERDSGISICTTEWTLQQRNKLPITQQTDKEEENIHLKSKLAKLESEVATIKNMMILKTTNGGGATAAAQ